MAATARTTITHPDGTVDKRGSQRRAYTHGVVRGPLVPANRIAFLERSTAALQAEIATLEEALVDPKFTKTFRGYKRDQDDVNSYDWALKGPVTPYQSTKSARYARSSGYPTIQTRATSDGVTQTLNDTDCTVISTNPAERGGFSNDSSNQWVLVSVRDYLIRSAQGRITHLSNLLIDNALEIQDIKAGTRNLGGYAAVRWSSSRDLAGKAADGEFSFLSDQGYQVYVQEVDKAL